MNGVWRNCSSCKKDILLGATYYECSVSSCSRKNAPVQFCTFDCWSLHNEVYRHRNAAAVEAKAPLKHDPPAEEKKKPAQKTSMPDVETLVVVSKVKKYVADRSGMNTSAGVMDALTRRIAKICDSAMENARASGRKTVLERDVPKD